MSLSRGRSCRRREITVLEAVISCLSMPNAGRRKDELCLGNIACRGDSARVYQEKKI